jgi:hypothetical protein
VKQQLPPTAHDRHDTMLVVRLYDDDVDAAERDRATTQIAACEECSALFADLGVIAKATKAMPTPARPRDFALTEADAARLRPRSTRRLRLAWPGLRRSFGGALMALGLVGVVLTSATATSSPVSLGLKNRVASGGQHDVATAGPAVPAAVNGGTPEMGAAGPSQGSLVVTDGGSPLPSPARMPQTPAPAASPASAPNVNPAPSASLEAQLAAPGASNSQTSSQGKGTGSATAGGTNTNGYITGGESNGPSAASGFDGRQLGLIGFGLAFLLGLCLLVAPRLSRLAPRRVRG